jgi:hypothetical protein
MKISALKHRTLLLKLESNDEEVIQSQEYPAHFTG